MRYYKTYKFIAVFSVIGFVAFLGAVIFWPGPQRGEAVQMPSSAPQTAASAQPAKVDNSLPAANFAADENITEELAPEEVTSEDKDTSSLFAQNSLGDNSPIQISSSDSGSSSDLASAIDSDPESSTRIIQTDSAAPSSAAGSSGTASGSSASAGTGSSGSSGTSGSGSTDGSGSSAANGSGTSGTGSGGSTDGGGSATGNPELATRATVPIMHEKYFVGERELFGYSPLFQPGVVTFDTSNRPTMRYGQVLQTLQNERWSEFNWYDKAGDSDAVTGPFVDERVVFDKDGSAYTLVTGGSSQSDKTVYLLFSPDYSTNRETPRWIRYKIAADRVARLEFNDTWNLKDYPPAILLYQVKNDTDILQLGLIIPKKTYNTLTFSDFIPISTTSVFNLQAGGAGNSVVSVGSKVHVVYPEQGEDTPQYARTYDRILKTISAPVLIGHGYTNGGGSSNPHCIPVISADSDGFLHVVTGAHNSKLTYTKSAVANSTQGGWSVPYNIGDDFGAGYVDYFSYVALICDQANTLHIVTRYYAEGGSYYTGKYSLAYTCKTKNGKWENPKFLVVPYHYAYSHYYHKLSIDRKGRLFVHYWYYADNLTQEEAAAYRAKWPGEQIRPRTDFVNGRRYYKDQTWHDPVILISDDGGDSWRIAITQDFVHGIIN